MAGTVALLIFLFAAPAYAVDHIVGDSSLWNTGVNYTNWASRQTFVVGDYLVFTYGSTHTVNEVNQAGYNSCSAVNSISTASDGNTTIALPTVGPRYFLCATPGHCSEGMKLAVTVAANSTSSTPPTTPSTTPPTTSKPPPPPPPPGNSSATSFRINHALVLGASLVLAAVIALMG